MSNKRQRRKKKPSKKRKPAPRQAPEVKSLSTGELKGIVAKARVEPISEGEQANLDAVIETLEWVTSELDNKTLTLARLRRLFGIQSSEKTKDVFAGGPSSEAKAGSGAETDANTAPEESGSPDGVGEAEPKPRKGHGRNGAADYVGAESFEVRHESLRPGGACPDCRRGRVYEQKDRPRILIRVRGEPPLQATVYRLQTLRCHLCGKIFTATPPEGVGDAKYDATAASMIAVLKYGSGLPFNRLEGLERNLGIPLPASTQWEIVAEAASTLTPVHEELVRLAAGGRVVHNDDTSMRVLSQMKDIAEEKRQSEANGRPHKGRVGIFCSGIVSVGDHRVALFFTGRKHAGENLSDVLQARAEELAAPLQMCDGLDRNQPAVFDTIVGNCLVHARRNFVAVAESFPSEVRYVLDLLGEVYKNDAVAKKKQLSDHDRLRYHQEHSAEVMQTLRAWMKAQIDERRVEPNSSLGQAIAYMEKRWDALTRFLAEPGAPLDNNVCERALKKAILHRKNALFYKTENGARVGDLYMSLIHTAELVGVNPFEYLTELLRHPEPVAETPANWLPWAYRATCEAVPTT
jgi:transposase